MNENSHLIKTILFVDDDGSYLNRLAKAFQKRNYHVYEAQSAACVTKGFDNGWKPDAAVVDLKLGNEDGLSLVRWLTERCPDIRILVLTGYGSIASAVHAMRIGACDYLTKPADADEIEKALLKNHANSPPSPPQEPASLGRVEWEHLQRVLREHGGNISAAARALRIERRSLQRKLQKLPPPR